MRASLLAPLRHRMLQDLGSRDIVSSKAATMSELSPPALRNITLTERRSRREVTMSSGVSGLDTFPV